MARVWLFRAGDDPTDGGPAWDLPLRELRDTLGVEEIHWLGDLSERPTFASTSIPPKLQGYVHVVAEVGADEARAAGWRPGFYHAPASPQLAMERLGKPWGGGQPWHR